MANPRPEKASRPTPKPYEPPSSPGQDRTCTALTRTGTRCGATPSLSSGSVYCWHHDPEVSRDEKLAAVTRGGYLSARQHTLPPDTLPPALRRPEDVTQLLQETVQQVRTGVIAPAVANSVGYLCGLALKSFDLNLGANLAELEEIALEKAKKVGGMEVRLVR